MIRYALVCAKGHEFESWFRNSETYEKQRKRSAVTCPTCGTARVDKALMAPRIGKGREVAVRRPLETQPEAQTTQQVVANAPALGAGVPPQFIEFVKRLRAEVEKSAEYVGPRFAEEARKMHYDEIEKRGIYGEASLEEARELSEEGIDLLPLPVLPEEQN